MPISTNTNNLFSVPSPISPEVLAATQIQGIGNQLFSGLIKNYTQAYMLVWSNKSATPDKIIAAMGTNAASVFTASAGLAVYLHSLGADVPLTSPSDWNIVFNQDGSATATKVSSSASA